MNDLPPDDQTGGTESDPTVRIPRSVTAGQRVGPYVLRERIGEGGMGEVWFADQTAPVRRRVAVKLVKPGLASPEVFARFEAERQALALMDHPCIASVYDAAITEDGRPYFVMEYVAGIPINQYCDQRRLGTKARLKLFQSVCEGVQHAHQKAVIHRDLKPSNILVADVDGRPLPKIIDFGVAKATSQRLTDKTLHTSVGQVIGTPEYVSPEQADYSGEDVDTRTDVYSLGVILYELLVGVLPFESKLFRKEGLAAVVRLLREQDPPRPSTRLSHMGQQTTEVARHRHTGPKRLFKELRGDLDWIVMRCLEKDRNRRYASALALAQDIQRHLDHQTIDARRPSIPYRAGKFVRRHPVAVTISTSIVLALVVLTITTTLQSARVAAERDRANHEARVTSEVSTFLTELFQIADPRESRGNSVTARELLDRGADRIRDSQWSDPRVQSRLLSVMGTAYSGLGLYPQARSLYAQALALNEQNLGGVTPATLSARHDLALADFGLGEYEAAEVELRALLEQQNRSLGGRHPDTALTQRTLARLLRNTGRLEESQRLYEDVLEIQRQILGDEDTETARTMNELGILYWSRGQYAKAEPLLTASLRTTEAKLGVDHPRTLSYRNNMAAFEHTGTHWSDVAPHRARAERLYRACLRSQREILGSQHPETLRTAFNLGSLLLSQERLSEAEPLLREAVDGRRKVLGEGHRATLLAEINLAHILRRQGATEEAQSLLEEVIARQREILDPYHREMRFSVSELYELLRDTGRLAEARPYLQELLAIERHAAARDDAAPEARNRYAWTLLTCVPEDLRDPETALDHARAAVEASDVPRPEYLRTLARAQAMTGDEAGARVTMEAALEILPVDEPERSDYELELAKYTR